MRQIHEESHFKRKRKNISKNTKKGETENSREKTKITKILKKRNLKNFQKILFSKKGKFKEGKNREIVTKKKIEKKSKIFLNVFLKNDEFNF